MFFDWSTHSRLLILGSDPQFATRHWGSLLTFHWSCWSGRAAGWIRDQQK